MKSDDQIEAAIVQAHAHENQFVAYLVGRGLRATSLSRGFRAKLADIADYAHDVDLDIEGLRCQYKHRHSSLAVFAARKIRPFLDEKVKADRTPVDFYILRFGDGTIVVPYAPETWETDTRWDPSDRALKVIYTVSIEDGISLEDWISSFSA